MKPKKLLSFARKKSYKDGNASASGSSLRFSQSPELGVIRGCIDL